MKDRKAAWDLCFHEEFKEIYAKQVKGYTFIGGHWGFHQNIEKFMDEYKSKLDPNLPFFYAQHPHPKDTIYGPWAWGHDNGASTRAFSKTPNAIVFTGHSHYPLTDESGILRSFPSEPPLSAISDIAITAKTAVTAVAPSNKCPA